MIEADTLCLLPAHWNRIPFSSQMRCRQTDGITKIQIHLISSFVCIRISIFKQTDDGRPTMQSLYLPFINVQKIQKYLFSFRIINGGLAGANSDDTIHEQIKNIIGWFRRSDWNPGRYFTHPYLSNFDSIQCRTRFMDTECHSSLLRSFAQYFIDSTVECDLNVANCHIHQALIRINIWHSGISDFSVGWVSDEWSAHRGSCNYVCPKLGLTTCISRWRPLNRFDWKVTCTSHTRWPQINYKFMFTWEKHSIRDSENRSMDVGQRGEIVAAITQAIIAIGLDFST